MGECSVGDRSRLWLLELYRHHQATATDGRDRIRLLGKLKGPKFEVASTFDVPAALGEYGAEYDENLKLEEGCVVTFVCPECEADLTTGQDPELAALKMNENGRDYIVVFSKVFGDHTSFLVDTATKTLVASYGDDAQAYIDELGKHVNFFGS